MPPLEPAPSAALSGRKVAVSERQKPEGTGGRLCPTLYPSRPPVGRMISHLFRRLISSQQPFRYSLSPSLPPSPVSYFLSLDLSISSSFLFLPTRPPPKLLGATSVQTLQARLLSVTIKDHSPHRVCLLTEALIKSRRESRKRRMGSTRAPRIIFATLRPFLVLVLPSLLTASLSRLSSLLGGKTRRNED